MAGFDTINKLYLPLKDMFRSNQNLLKYIAYDSDDPLSEPDIEDIESLFDSRVWFRPKATNTITEMESDVIVTFLVKPTNGSVLYGDTYLNFDIITHNNLFTISDEQNPFRVFDIANEINEYLVGSKGNWVGKCIFVGANPITTINNDFSGYRIVYKITDFNFNYRNKNEVV